jgi:hypothetical protein
MHLTLPAAVPAPYVAADERALVLCDGRRAHLLGAALFAWVRSTLSILLEEGRATRVQSDRVLGGFVDAEGAIVLFAGTQAELLSVRVERAHLSELLEKLGSR